MKLHDLGHLGYYNEKLRIANDTIQQIHIGEQKFFKSKFGVVVNLLNPNLFSEVISVLGFSVSYHVFLIEFRFAIDKFMKTSFFDDDLGDYVDLYFDNIVSSLRMKVDEFEANQEQLFMAKLFDKAVISKFIDNCELDGLSNYVNDLVYEYQLIATQSFGKRGTGLCFKGVFAYYTTKLIELVEHQRKEVHRNFLDNERFNELVITKKGQELLLNEFTTYVSESLTDLAALVNQKQMVSKIKVRLKKGILIEFFKRMRYNGYIKCNTNQELAAFLSKNFQYNSGVKFLGIDVHGTKKSYLDRFDKEPDIEKMILLDKVEYTPPNDRGRILM